MPKKKNTKKKDDLIQYKKYANDVLNGKIIACRYIKLACQRYLNFFKRKDLYFNEKAIQQIINFSKKIKLENGQPFIIEEWQKWIIYSIFGFYYKKQPDKRLVNTVQIEISRKNGKSFLASFLCCYGLIEGLNKNNEIEIVANSKKQAGIIFRMLSNMLADIDPKQKIFKRFRDNVRLDATNSFIQVLSSDVKNNDGWNSNMAIFDEVECFENADMYNLLRSSQQARLNPLAICIHTAGFDLGGFCYQMRSSNIEILEGTKTNDSQFVALYGLDGDDNYKDPEVWIKANPNLGVTVKKDALKLQITEAEINPTLERSTKTKNFNIWCSTSEIWIPEHKITAIQDDIDIDNLALNEPYIFGGVDLASVNDLTALSVLIPIDDKLYFKNYYFIPETLLENHPNSTLYVEWVNNGYLIATPSNVTDYDFITKEILQINDKMLFQKIGYDRYNATQWGIQMTENNMPIFPISQSMTSLSMGVKELERRILQQTVIIDKNPLNNYCFRNSRPKLDWNENVKIVKQSNNQKIDGVIAMVMALMCYLSTINYSTDIEVLSI